MGVRGWLHHHPGHRARQLRWVLPIAVVLLAAALASLGIEYWIGDQAVGTEFFRAHKTISHTGQLLWQGLLIGAAAVVVPMLVVGLWALRLTHRIVRPVHTLHRALDALAAGDLGVRVELHRHDEFHEVGEALNRLIDEFATTLAAVHGLVDRVHATTGAEGRDPGLHEIVVELDRTMEFFRLEPRRTVREDGA
jgi:methyl-accepting chemotaxis protein